MLNKHTLLFKKKEDDEITFINTFMFREILKKNSLSID